MRATISARPIADFTSRFSSLPQGTCLECRRALLAQDLRRPRHRPLASYSRFTVPSQRITRSPPSRLLTSAVNTVVSSARPKNPKKTILSSRDALCASTTTFDSIHLAERLVNTIIGSDTTIPSEEEIITALEACHAAAREIAHPATHSGPSATASLLSLDSRPSGSTGVPIDHLSDLAYRLIRHPTVFISPKALSTYVEVQCLLQRPASFPEVFNLYAKKPVPRMGGNAVVEYKEPNPNRAASAVAPDVANAALSAAIMKKDLFAALDTIEATFSTTAYQRAKFLRKGLPPVTGFAMAPFAAYVLATRFSEWQDSMEPSMATGIAGAGILTYFGVIGTVGYVAVTTSNDQMDRVTWATGTPLYLRWLREDERAAIDRVAGAWGLKDPWKRGEEEGEEWEFLREWIGFRGMVLDKIELMEGME